ncbi:MAG: MarR family transcriptional regulator [Bacteroidales bacterium]
MEQLCKIRDIQRSIIEFETNFEQCYHICLNEGMLLCSLSTAQHLSSGEIGELLGLTLSNTSKVIKSVEEKGLIERVVGKKDKRQMYFSLTNKGKKLLSNIQCKQIEMPKFLKKVMNNFTE